MKVELDDLRLGVSDLTDTAYVGILEKSKPNVWKHKKDVHNDFLHAVVTLFEGNPTELSNGEKTYNIVVDEINTEADCRCESCKDGKLLAPDTKCLKCGLCRISK